MFRRAVLLFSFLMLCAVMVYTSSVPAWSAPLRQSETQALQTGIVNTGANLRAGPGANFARVGGVRSGQTVTIVGQNTAGDWYELASGQWIAAFLVTVNPAQPVATAQPPAGQLAQVTRIVDGDTIDVVINGETHRVRYILVNTPEVGQPLAAEATEANRGLVAGKTIYLVKDVSETDRYGRLLRYVYLADGTFVNAALVRQGFAQLATFPPDVSKQAEIQAAQQEAMAANRGLWADEGGEAPPPAAPVATATPTPAPPPPVEPQTNTNCHLSYEPCIPVASDADCAGGSGNGPVYVEGPVKVVGPDDYGLDRDGDGWGCE